MLPDIAKKLISSYPCRGLESSRNRKSCAMATLVRGLEGKELTTIFISSINRKSVTMVTYVTRYCQKANQLQCILGFGIKMIKIIFTSPRNTKSVAMAGIAKK